MTDPETEIRTAVAVLTAALGAIQEPERAVDNVAAIRALVDDVWPGDPIVAIPSIAYVCLRALSVAALETGTTPGAILAQLGAEASGPPAP